MMPLNVLEAPDDLMSPEDSLSEHINLAPQNSPHYMETSVDWMTTFELQACFYD
jgi:hypothetical protein